MIARVWHGAIALAVLAGLVVQIVMVARLHAAPHDVTPGVVAGATAPARFLRLLSFFTIQSNLLVGFTSTALALDPGRNGRIWRVVRLDALVGIAVTGIVYSTVLARMHEPKGWEQVTTNTLFHYVTPIATVLGWLLFGPRPRIDRTTVVTALAWPAAWFGYTLARGTSDHWYPYPFVDAVTHGYARVLLNAVLVTLVLGAVSALFWFGDSRLRAAP
jgi:predicted secreted protein